MRTVHSAPATPLLRPFVRAFAHRTAVGGAAAQTMPAFLETVIHFDFADVLTVKSSGGIFERARPLAVVGPHTHPGTSVRLDGTIDSFAIFLQPAALWSLFEIPTSAVMESNFDAADVLGPPIVELWHLLGETGDLASRVRVAERFLVANGHFDTRETASTTAATMLARSGGRLSIRELASRVNFSVRQLERSFIRELGITPKRFARVARFQSALDARVWRPERSWLDIAVASGYHDQMHLVHDFQSLGGLSPARIVETLGDSRPLALAASHERSA